MADKIRVGVIGTGFGAAVQIPGFQDSQDFEVVAVCSGREERARQAAERFRIPHCYTDYHEMLRLKDVDLVSVATPPYLHYPMSMDALRAGKHVLCEKPMALDLKQAREMLELARSKGVVHMITHEFRWVPPRRWFEELIKEGYVGKPYQLSITQFLGGPADPASRPFGWTAEASKGGGYFGGMGSHLIDCIRNIFGEIDGIYGQGDHPIKLRHDPATGKMREQDADEYFTFVFRLRDGVLGLATLGTVGRFGPGLRIEAYGSKGTLFLEGDRVVRGAQEGDKALQELPVPQRLLSPKEYPDARLWPFMNLIGLLAQSIRERREISPTFYDGVKHMEGLEAIRRSHATGRWVSLPLTSTRRKRVAA